MSPKPEKIKKFRSDLSKIRDRGRRMEEGGKFWNPKEGENRIRILSPWNNEGVFYLERVLHYGFKDATGGRAYPCLRHFGNAPCPACQVTARYKSETDADIKKIVQKLKPKSKWFMNIIPRGGDGDPQIKIYGATFSVMKPILGYFNDEDYGDITDPEEGRDITVIREGTGFTTSYEVRIGGKPKPVGVDGWEDNLFNLDTDVDRDIIDGPTMLGLIEQSYPELDLEGIAAGESKSKAKVEAEEDEEEPVEKPKKTKKAKPPVEEDEELEEEDDD